MFDGGNCGLTEAGPRRGIKCGPTCSFFLHSLVFVPLGIEAGLDKTGLVVHLVPHLENNGYRGGGVWGVWGMGIS